MFIKKTEKEIWAELKKRPLEDAEAIKAIEDFFLEKRGYIFKMPKPGEPVILLLSGGIDSIVLWDILMSKYKLNVYPLYIARANTILKWIGHEYRSIQYFEKYYQKRYKKLFHSKTSVSIGKPLVKKIIQAVFKNPMEILNNIDVDGSINVQNYSTTNLLASVALDYSQLLQAQKNIKVNTIFTGNLETDGLMIKNQTFTSLRSIMFTLCNISGDYEKQFTSLFMEKSLGFFYDKKFVVNWAKKYNIPIIRTWTCWKRSGILPCGVCKACSHRRYVIGMSGLIDTLYISDFSKIGLTIRNKVLIIKHRVINIVRRVFSL